MHRHRPPSRCSTILSINLEAHLPTSSPRHDPPSRRFARIAHSIAIALLAGIALGPFVAARADELQDVSKLVSTGKIDEAEQRADAFLAKTPKDAQMRFLKGVILAQRGKRDDAIKTFTAITQDYPELPEPYNNLAVIYAAQGQYDNARNALETAVRVSPNYATAYENLGDVYAALAAKSYQDARRHDGSNAAALRKLNATRAMLAGTPVPVAAASTPAKPEAANVEVTRSQRNVGLPSPAGPRITVGGSGAVAPDIVVAPNTPAVPQGSNVVAIESAPAVDRRLDTTPLADAATVVGGDPAQPGVDVATVTAAVQRWAQAKGMNTDRVRVRVDGDIAVARFDATPRSSRKKVVSHRLLAFRRDGASWAVTEDRSE